MAVFILRTESTQDVLVASIDDWRKGLNDNMLTGVALTDLTKAFDSIDKGGCMVQ